MTIKRKVYNGHARGLHCAMTWYNSIGYNGVMSYAIVTISLLYVMWRDAVVIKRVLLWVTRQDNIRFGLKVIYKVAWGVVCYSNCKWPLSYDLSFSGWCAIPVYDEVVIWYRCTVLWSVITGYVAWCICLFVSILLWLKWSDLSACCHSDGDEWLKLCELYKVRVHSRCFRT